AYLLFARRDPSRRTYVLCGALWGIAFFLFQGTAFDIAAMFLCLSYVHRKSLRAALASGACLLFGFSVVTAAVSLYFVSQGTLEEAAHSMLLRPILGYARLGPKSTSAVEMIQARIHLAYFCSRKLLAAFSLQWLAVLAGVCRIVMDGWKRASLTQEPGASREDESRARLMFCGCLVWLAADLLGVLATGRFYDHYMLPFVPWLTLACMFWMRGMDRPSRATLATGVMAVLYVLAACHLGASAWQDGLSPRKVRRSQGIAEFIRTHTRKDERIFLYRFGGMDVFYLSERLPSNGIYEYVDMCENHIKDRELAAAKREELLNRPPAVMVVDPSVGTDACDSNEFFENLIRENYRRETVILGSEVYVRNADSRRGEGGFMTPEGRSGPSAPSP
ncbi:MAG TPA: hypothetical protein VGR38_09665, partial [Candidatus Polarisedimenticolia bacterium]|nr:hypothetical protein [Candidatus Polarisedimenticolia bacterium]